VKKLSWLVLTVLTLPACGGYDAEHACEESAACEERVTGQPVSRAAVEGCISRSEDAYDEANEDIQDSVDDAFDACEDYEACSYFVCVCEFFGTTTSDPNCVEARKHL